MSKMRRHDALLIALAALCALATPLFAQPSSPVPSHGSGAQARAAAGRAAEDSRSLPDTRMGRLAGLWLGAFDRGDSASITQLVTERYAPAALMGRPAASIAVRERWRARNLGPAAVVRVESASDSSISLLVHHAAVDSWGHLTLQSPASAEGRIASVALTRMEPPPEDLSPHGRLGDEAIAARLDSFVTRLARDGRFAGAVGVVHDGRIVSARAYGMANAEHAVPNTIDTRFQLASVGKMFTAVTIAKLVEQGRLGYDDAIGKWIPDYPNAVAARTVTIRHLLTHSSGIADYFMNPEWDAMDKEALNAGPQEALFRFFADKPLSFTPGSRTSYANANYLLLGVIAERAAHGRYADLYARTAFGPARMTSTWRADAALPRATGYTWYGPRRTLDLHGPAVATDEPVSGSPAGGGISTLGDMLRFAAGMMDGTLISRATLAGMVARHGIDDSPTSWPGYGFDAVELYRGVPVANKSGSTYGTHAQFDVYPESGYAVVVLSNVETWAAEAVAYEARELITRR